MSKATFEFEAVVCSNAETVFGGVQDVTGNGWKDEAAEAVSAGCAILQKASAIKNYETDLIFRHWNGGKYTQFVFVCGRKHMHTAGLVVCSAYKVETDEDGDRTREALDWCDLPDSERAEVEKAIDSAADAMNEYVQRCIAAQEAETTK